MSTRRDVRAANLRRIARPSAAFEVVIDELVLRGFPAAGHGSIGDALSLEMAQLLSHPAALPFPGPDTSLPLVDSGRITLLPDAPPASVGARVARAVYTGLQTGVRGGK